MIEVWSQSPKAYVVKAVYPQSNIAMDKSLFLDDFTINPFIYIGLWWIFQLATFNFPPFRITPVVDFQPQPRSVAIVCCMQVAGLPSHQVLAGC